MKSLFLSRTKGLLFIFFALFLCYTSSFSSLEAAQTINPKAGEEQVAPTKKAKEPVVRPNITPPATAPLLQQDSRGATSPDKTQASNQKTLMPTIYPEGEILPLEGLTRPTLITQSVALVFMSLLPFLVMILSSFVKIVVVLSLLRSALGVQQAPPNQVINGIAFLLSIYVMFPTGVKMYDAAHDVLVKKAPPQELLSGESAGYILEVANAAKEPLRDFLKNNSLIKHQRTFYKTVYRLMPDEYRDLLKPEDFLVIVPAYITSQLKAAFEIGVLIYIPFFVIDLVVSNILLAMGMMMLSPVTISMPLKLFLLVMLDGWTLLIQGLVATFR
jgi:type III secretion protein R